MFVLLNASIPIIENGFSSLQVKSLKRRVASCAILFYYLIIIKIYHTGLSRFITKEVRHVYHVLGNSFRCGYDAHRPLWEDLYSISNSTRTIKR